MVLVIFFLGQKVSYIFEAREIMFMFFISCSQSRGKKNFSVAIDREPNATKILRKIKRKKKS